jgi:hypothetical protein
MRKLLIFGNGLGRSLDNDFFNLEGALQKAWEEPLVLDENQKRLIRICLPDGVIEDDPILAPKREEELDRLQLVLAACDEISKFEVLGGPSWLSDDGKKFPSAIRSYIHRAASYFHEGGFTLPEGFVGPLARHILDSRSHVATLNYDGLLYRAFVNTPVFKGFSCCIDGFVRKFDPGYLRRDRPHQQSYYLHLHGSPLYITDADGQIVKKSMGDILAIRGYSSSHLVLTHVKHKEKVIAASPVLREYWARLLEAMNECDGVVLFGYGGGDLHLNRLITECFREKQIEVVERKKPEYDLEDGKNARFSYWAELLGKSPWIWWHENILDHQSWDWEQTKLSPAA